MRLLSRLLGSSHSPQVRAETVVKATIFPGHETLEVVGESSYQDELWIIVGGFRRERVRHECVAVLIPEPDNPFDGNAIRIVVDGSLVGYLSREDAVAYLPGLNRLMAICETGHVALEGQVVGGGDRGGRLASLGVFLDHNPIDFGIAPHYTTGGTLRTGLGEAIATDREDDSYDLSWLTALPDDDEQAAQQLRLLLEAERDPIDRHYMLSELESRLYRCRAARPSALDEFDAICEQHHEEMRVLRRALITKFGAVPVIEFYRQAAIRCQKARQWETAREWAQRGIGVYGDRAARAEAVEDLHKRVAHASEKIEAAARPKLQRGLSVAVVLSPEPNTESLVCFACGESFERQRTPGRKPKTCPTCRSSQPPPR